MPLQHIALLINSKAGKNNALRLSNSLNVQLELRKIKHAVFIDEWPSELNEFTEVWIAGGDGTLNYFINKYPDCDIPIAIFKGGTSNDVAWKLYGNMETERQLDHILKVAPKPVDAGLCNEKLFINGIGIGFDGEVLQSVKSIRLIGGHLGYLLVVIKKIFSFNEHHFNIEIDGYKIEEPFLLMMIFNSSRTGGGFHVAPNALLDDGLLNTIFCKPLSVFQRLRYLPVIEKGKHLNFPFIKHKVAREIVISCNSLLPAQCDGELIFNSQFKIKVLPAKFLFKY